MFLGDMWNQRTWLDLNIPGSLVEISDKKPYSSIVLARSFIRHINTFIRMKLNIMLLTTGSGSPDLLGIGDKKHNSPIVLARSFIRHINTVIRMSFIRHINMYIYKNVLYTSHKYIYKNVLYTPHKYIYKNDT